MKGPWVHYREMKDELELRAVQLGRCSRRNAELVAELSLYRNELDNLLERTVFCDVREEMAHDSAVRFGVRMDISAEMLRHAQGDMRDHVARRLGNMIEQKIRYVEPVYLRGGPLEPSSS